MIVEIVKTYADAGESGVDLARRPGMQTNALARRDQSIAGDGSDRVCL